MKIKYNLQPETIEALNKLFATCPGTVAEQSMKIGIFNGEPVLVMIDAAIRYAKAHKVAYDQPVNDDYMLRDEFAGILRGIRAMLDFNGGVALEMERSTDSKDNGVIESLYWTACEIAGFDGDAI
jgi:phosphopantetheine adenylyltransferase